ncbi:hypothetical protein A7U60_g9151 [Sanghuangporus baumii]|uniref:Uncharacterized protein n=1 Tax=Sanghuangporus baumii TaxID=108892 RepID=A0A9Q5MXH0_SANBA|nr:hypothetical protein A7U60_g9151 [Sanghuangporus baumii]
MREGLFSFWTGSVSALITMVLIDYIILIRVPALYHQNNKLDLCLKFLLALNAIAGLTMLIYGNQVEQYTAGSLAEVITVCGYNGLVQKNLSIISWTVPLALESLLLILALPKAAEYWKPSFGFKGLHLIGVLIRDQLIYFGSIILFCVLNIVELSVPDIDVNISYFLGMIANPTMLCLLGGQLLINMKEAGERGANAGTSYIPSVGNIEFA